MTLVKLGYVAMSMNLQHSSPSQTMTYKQFAGIKDRETAIHKLERIAKSTNMFLDFLNGIKGSVNEIDCMIEA